MGSTSTATSTSTTDVKVKVDVNRARARTPRHASKTFVRHVLTREHHTALRERRSSPYLAAHGLRHPRRRLHLVRDMERRVGGGRGRITPSAGLACGPACLLQAVQHMPQDVDLLPSGLRRHLTRQYPASRVVSTRRLAPDSGSDRGSTAKAAGYGLPVHLVLQHPDGQQLDLVWRLASANELGHDRRSDRAANQLLAFDDFACVPRHIAAIDVGAIDKDGELVSLRGCSELYLITAYAHGTTYADDLRAIARDQAAGARDLARADALAGYLARLHVPIDDPPRYRRAIRDLVGAGEGIYGIVDSYPDDVPGVTAERLHGIERACAAWRWRLRGHEGRLVRTHGDFHPFNVIFGEGADFTALDASRGTCGDAADDVTAMSINYLLFALDAEGSWKRGLGTLWHRFWQTYSAARSDPSLHACAPPYFAWRALVVCNPRFYPALSAGGRAALLGLAEGALAANHFEPRWADELFS